MFKPIHCSLFIFLVLRKGKGKKKRKPIPLFPFSLQQDLDFLLSPEAWVSESKYDDRALDIKAYEGSKPMKCKGRMWDLAEEKV